MEVVNAVVRGESRRVRGTRSGPERGREKRKAEGIKEGVGRPP